jgi:cell wall-associated NlpC family hydrolase
MAPDLVKAQYLRAKAVEYAWSFLGLPYRWGGDDPIQGFDCSGLVIEVLQSVGILPHGFDTTAEGLYQRFKACAVARGYAGCLVLWFSASGLATHVELMVDDFHTIGASGGGPSTTSPQAAVDQNAFVKMRPLGYRGSNFKIVDPFLGVLA